MEPAGDRLDDRMNVPTLRVHVVAAMEPAENRLDDVAIDQVALPVSGAAMEPAGDRLDDPWQNMFAAMFALPQWSQPGSAG